MLDRRPTVLVVHPDAATRQQLADHLTDAGFSTTACETTSDGRTRLDAFAYDAMVVHTDLPDGQGLDLLDIALARYRAMRVIVTAARADVMAAVRAMKAGAVDFLVEPVSPAQLTAAFAEVRADRPRRSEPPPPAARPRSAFRTGAIVGESAAMQPVLRALERTAPTHATILIQGETGTGKELVARTIHANSPREGRPFVAFNAAALPEGLVEAELFGHVKGAFTGATASRVGRFELASSGTLFIDEVSSMPLAVQAKLLRALQEREIERVGTSTPIRIDVRVVAAVNEDLPTLIREGRFRGDLYYRLNVVRVALPPLRDRREDIPLLARQFVLQSCAGNHLPPKTLTQETLQALMRAPWPGNVRQLQNAIEHAVAMSGRSPEIDVSALPDEIRTPAAGAAGLPFAEAPDGSICFASAMTQFERDLLLRYLARNNGNKRRTARMLNMSRTTLIDKLQRLGLDHPAA